ncbi:putative FBD-associated F-box protein [Cardamine amara subsp. amara]|uniref:FBD-associated F-box protein n=1 Tax=Cardamine amara subsp. amara TaxID=228776 RepID=A0ABD1C3J2_CARAN
MIEINTRDHFNYHGHLLPQEFRKRNIFYDFLTGISSVRHMIICQWIPKVLYCYSKLEPIPQFHNLYYLQVKYFSTLLQLLPAFLESCPNLKILSLVDIPYSEDPRQVDFTNVPQCLMSTLEYVEIKKWITKDETGIIKLVNYFLENSAVLKKLTLSFKNPCITKQEAESCKKLLTSTKLSPTCQVIIE